MIPESDDTKYCENDWVVSFRSGSGLVLSAVLLRLDKESVAFEISSIPLILRTSEVLDDFKVSMKNRCVYSGAATLTTVIQSGTTITCEASLSADWLEAGKESSQTTGLREAFFTQWNAHRRVEKRFKLAVGDLHCFIAELRRWLDQEALELAVKGNGQGESLEAGRLDEILLAVNPTLDGLFERFEEACNDISPDAQAAHRVYLRRILHPLLMACPFMHRIYTKPLGYAGDYEMMNMIWRNGFEGDSMFAKLLNRYIINQAPGISVRNRVDYMTERLVEEASRAVSSYGDARVYSVGCGPAREVRNFLTQPNARHTRFVLLDFNDETLKHTRGSIDELCRHSGRKASVDYVEKSAHFLLREDAGTAGSGGGTYDLIYSSGLYDYLNDRMCVALNSHLYELLRPGGVLIVTNFTTANPIQNVMEFMFEWFLIHRDNRQMQQISPSQADPGDCRVRVDSTGCNAFLEARKPTS